MWHLAEVYCAIILLAIVMGLSNFRSTPVMICLKKIPHCTKNLWLLTTNESTRSSLGDELGQLTELAGLKLKLRIS